MPADKRLATLMATCVFQVPDSARQIPGIDVAQAGIPANFGGPQQILRAGVLRIVHLVVFVKCSHMPRDIGRHAGEKVRQPFKFVVRIVKARDQQGNNLEPHTHLMQAPDRVQNRADASAQLVVVAIVETLEIDFVEIDPGPNVFQNLRRAVAVGHKSGDQAGRLRLLKYLQPPIRR